MTDRKLFLSFLLFTASMIGVIWLITDYRQNRQEWTPEPISIPRGEGGQSEAERIKQVYRPGFICPVRPDDNRFVTSWFGTRISPTSGELQEHLAIDMAIGYTAVQIKSGYHAEILASETGTVWEVSKNRIDGNYIVILHDNGWRTKYNHLSKVYVKKRQKVEKGHVIGRMGSTGRSTGEHLDFSIWQYGAAVDPLQALRIRPDSEGRF